MKVIYVDAQSKILEEERHDLMQCKHCFNSLNHELAFSKGDGANLYCSRSCATQQDYAYSFETPAASAGNYSVK